MMRYHGDGIATFNHRLTVGLAGGRYAVTVRYQSMNPFTLRQWRLGHNYTQAELGDVLGVSPITVNRWEQGERDAPWVMLELALHGVLFTHGELCRCPNRRCRCRPNRIAENGRVYDPR